MSWRAVTIWCLMACSAPNGGLHLRSCFGPPFFFVDGTGGSGSSHLLYVVTGLPVDLEIRS